MNRCPLILAEAGHLSEGDSKARPGDGYALPPSRGLTTLDHTGSSNPANPKESSVIWKRLLGARCRGRPGHCRRADRRPSAGPGWVGPNRHRLAGNYFVKIVAYRC
jgi:hypothetical protein